MKKADTTLNGLIFISDINGKLRICELIDNRFIELLQLSIRVRYWDLTPTMLACATDNQVIIYSLNESLKELYVLKYEEEVDFVKVLEDELLVVTRDGHIKIIKLSNKKIKEAKCNKRNNLAALSFNEQELIYINKEGSIGVYSLKEHEEKLIPYDGENVYRVWKIKDLFIIRKKNSIQVFVIQSEEKLELKCELKGNITAVMVKDEVLAYASLNDPYILIIELPSLGELKKIKREFEVLALELIESHLIAFGINTFAVYSVVGERIKFTTKLTNPK